MSNDSIYETMLFLFCVLQVNGSDGMYKYEEIILERVNIIQLVYMSVFRGSCKNFQYSLSPLLPMGTWTLDGSKC